MALKHVLLGMIALFGPRSGYTLHKDIFAPGRPTLPQIYHALTSMNEEKLVVHERVHGEKAPSKNIFRLSPAGYVELKNWLKEQEFIVPMREPLMQKIWFGSIAEMDTILDSLNSFIEQRKVEEKYYKEQKNRFIGHPSKGRPGNPANKFYWSLVLDYVTTRVRQDMEWAENVIQKISLNAEVLRKGDGSKKDENQWSETM